MPPTIDRSDPDVLSSLSRGSARLDSSLPRGSAGFDFEPSIATSLLAPFAGLRAELPRELRLALQDLPKSPSEGRLSLSAFSGWLEDACHALKDQGVGLRALAHLERGVGDVVELGAAAAATLADALTFLARHICILNEAAEFGLWVDGEVACFELRSSVYVPRALRDFQLGAVFFAIRKWLGDPCDSQICFAYREPDDAALHRSLFAPSVVRFETPCDRILLKASSLALPLCSRDAAIHRVLSRHAQQLESEHNADDGLARRVRTVLLDLLSCGKGDADEIARRLGVSRRTLTRHLAREGVNFRQLLEEVRHQSALRFLETTNLELSRIAVMLGYTDTSSFCRAFVRWSAQSPLAYRRAFRAGLSSLRSKVYSC